MIDDTLLPPDEGGDEPSLSDVISNAITEQDTSKTAEPAREPAQKAEPAKADEADRNDGRDEKGRFAPKVEQEERPNTKASGSANRGAAPAAQNLPNGQEQDTQADPALQVRPPPGWSPQSKADFAKLAPHIQQDIAKREVEISNGFAEMSELKELKELKPFAALAKQNGTTLPAAFGEYRNFEVMLKEDPLKALDLICTRYGYSPIQVAQAMHARHSSPQAQQQAQQPRPQPQIDPNTIARQAAQLARDEMRQEQVQAEIAAFSRDPANIYYANVEPMMQILIERGQVDRSKGVAAALRQAYDQAIRIVPEVAALVSQQSANPVQARANAANQARAAAKATVSAPSSATRSGTAHNGHASLRDDIEAAIDAQAGRL
jgi:hypothetical protein